MRMWEIAFFVLVIGAVYVGVRWAENYRYSHIVDGANASCYLDTWSGRGHCVDLESIVDLTWEEEA